MTRWMILSLLLCFCCTFAWAEPVNIEPATQEGTDVKPIEVKKTDAKYERIVLGDQVDELEKQLKPEARFSDHKTKWRVEERTFKYRYYPDRVKTNTYTTVWDGDRFVAMLRSGDILLVGRTPDSARTKVKMPTERHHLDNLLGPSLPIYQFFQKAKTHGSIHRDIADLEAKQWWESNGDVLVLRREQTLPDYTIKAKFIFSVDPIYGYRVDAVRDVVFNKYEPGKVKMGGGSFTPGCYVPWEYAAVYDRTVWTPISGEIEGWANNLVTMDRCDANKGKFAWKDGGFISYLSKRDGWGVVFTRADGTGDTPSLNLCNAHNDFHIKFILKDLPKKDGKHHFHAVHRLMSLPPAMSAYLWDNVKLIQQNATMPILKLGRVEDMEDQPVKLTEPARGLTWTSNPPKVVEGIAHSGTKSLLIDGREWPNLPQVSLKPNVRYRLEGWFKVERYTKEELAEKKAKDDRRREQMKKKGKELPAPIDWDNLEPRAFITGDFYEWSPYTNPMVVKMKTNEATAKTSEWQHVKVDFDSPAWGPFINISFHCQGGKAYLDDFALRELGPVEEKKDKDGSVASK